MQGVLPMSKMTCVILTFSVFVTVVEVQGQNRDRYCLADTTAKTCVNCNFEDDICQWRNEDGTSLTWTRTCVTRLACFFGGNHYMSAGVSGHGAGSKARLESPWIAAQPRHLYSLRFRYYIETDNTCLLSVFLETTGNAKRSLWSTQNASDDPWTSTETDSFNFNAEYHKIVFEGEKLSDAPCGTQYDEIDVDDVVLEFKGIVSTVGPLSTLSTTNGVVLTTTEFEPTVMTGRTVTHGLLYTSPETSEHTTPGRTGANENSSTSLPPEDNDSILSAGLLAGITLAVVVVVIVCILVLLLLWFRRQKDKNSSWYKDIFHLRWPCLKSKDKLAQRRTTAVTNAAYTTEDNQIPVHVFPAGVSARADGSTAEDYTYSTPHKARASKALEAGGVAVTSTSVYELASFPQDDEHYSTPTDISQSHRDAWSRDSTVAGTTHNGLDSYNHLALQNPREALGGAAKPDAYDHLSGHEAREDGHGKGPQQLTGKGKPGYENVTSFAETPPPRHDEYNTLDREHPPGHRDLDDIKAQYNHLNEQANC